MRHPINLHDCSSARTEVSVQASSLTTEWMDTAAASRYLAVSPASLRNMVSQGKIPYYKLGRCNRYRISDLENLVLKTKRGAICR
jgi:excisionase family DNA binding protein